MAHTRLKRWLRLLPGAVLAAWASQAHALGLLQAYEAAVKNDPAYRVAIHANEAGQENRMLGRAALLPTLSASSTAAKNKADIQYGDRAPTPQDYISRSATLQLRQPVLNMESIARYRQGVAQSQASTYQFLSQGQEVILRVVSAYLDVLLRQDQVELAKVQREVLVEQHKLNQRLFDKGEGTRTDLLEIQARLDVAEAQLLEAETELQGARDTLAGVTGVEFDQLDPLRPDFRGRPPEGGSFEAWRALALERNPALQALRTGVEIAKQEIAKQRAGHYPRLDVYASLSRQVSDSINTLNTESKVRSLGFQLNVPLYAGGAVNASVRQASANRERAKAELDEQQARLLTDLRKDYNQVSSGAARIDALIKSVESATLLIKATQQSIKGGVRINLDLLNAQQQLYTSKRDLAQARYQYLMSMLRLRAAGGTLSRSDVQEVAAYFR